MNAGPTVLHELPFDGSSPIRAYVRPRLVRIRSTDAADALGIPRSGDWANRVAEEMRRRGFDGPRLMRIGDKPARGYEKIDAASGA